MADPTHEELADQLIYELSQFEIDCSHTQADLLIRDLELVLEKNKVVNLTRIEALRDAVTLHLVDSLVPLGTKTFKPSEGLRFLDIGTGAGFPGIPLVIMTGMEGLLIDSVGKKVTAVNEFIHELSLTSCKAEAIRAEVLAQRVPGSFDYVFARAVAQSNVIIEYAAPLLKLGGSLILEKANLSESELQNANYASQICGLQRLSRDSLEFPRGLGHREILTYQKVAKPHIKLPRANGMAKKHPLVPKSNLCNVSTLK